MSIKEEEAKLKDICTSGNSKDSFRLAESYEISRQDFQTLQTGKWLNDNVINTFATLIRRRAEVAGDKVAFLDSNFFSRLALGNDCRKWAKKVEDTCNIS